MKTLVIVLLCLLLSGCCGLCQMELQYKQLVAQEVPK